MKKPKRSQVLTDVSEYFSQAKNLYKTDSQLAKRYIQKGRRLAMKHTIRLPRDMKMQFCRHCYQVFIPGVSCSIRLSNSFQCFICKKCEKVTRFGIRK